MAQFCTVEVVSGLQIGGDVSWRLCSNNGSFQVSAAYRMMNLFFNLETFHNDESFLSTTGFGSSWKTKIRHKVACFVRFRRRKPSLDRTI